MSAELRHGPGPSLGSRDAATTPHGLGAEPTERCEGPRLVSDFRVDVVVAGTAVSSLLVSRDEPRPMLVGSSSACDLRVQDPAASRRHASLEATPHGLLVVDLRSTNGTFVGGLRVREAWLSGGEEIRIGAARMRVQRVGVPAPVEPPARVRFGKLIGASRAMRRLYPYCDRIAASDVPVLIEGETGTGKEVLAESLHAASARRDGPFIVFDCTTVAPSLVESTLFGHERGAFTGAQSANPGVFELASGGTLFIDEIGDLDIALQAKLLRAIQAGEVQRLGGRSWRKVDVRIISATRRDLERAAQAGRFRDDLYFRLVVARLQLPALRDRREDVPILARLFWRQLGGADEAFPDAMLAALDDHEWPGNVRELHNRVAQRIALGDLADRPSSRALTTDSSPCASAAPRDFIDAVIADEQPLARARERIVFEFERRYLDVVIRKFHGDTVKAADALGIGRRYLYRIKQRRG